MASEVVAEPLRALERRLAHTPAACEEAGRAHDASRQDHEERDGQVRHRLGVLAGRRDHGQAALGCGLDVDVDRPAARAADETQRRRGVEHRSRDRAAVHDEPVVVAQSLGDLPGRAGIFTDAPIRLAAADLRLLHVQLQVLEAMVVAEPRERLPEDLDRHVRVADDQELHSGYTQLGLRSTAWPEPDSMITLSIGWVSR